MKKNSSFAILLVVLLSATFDLFSQVGINTDGSNADPAAMLDVKSTSKGVLPPRMTTAQMNSIITPPAGLLVYNISVNSLYWYNGSLWKKFSETIVESDPVFTAHPSNGITAANIANWNAAYGWGNHAGLYRPATWVPSWTDITGKPSFATVATTGNYNDLINKPIILNSQWGTAGNDIYYTPGNVGIGITAPLSKLHVHNGSVLFSGTIGATPFTGAGGRTMWVQEKRAFRTGMVTASHWDADSLGLNSFASGYNTVATGNSATAVGYLTSAWGDYGATALGYYSKANGAYGSMAIGCFAKANGPNGSVALGYYTEASGTYGSMAAGSYSVASGNGAMALGRYTTAAGVGSFASNYRTLASGSHSAAFGVYTNAKPYGSFVIGRYNIVSGDSLDWVGTDPVFVVGNGSSSTELSNAMTILKDGRVGVGTETPDATFDVYNGNVLFSGATGDAPVSGSGGRFMWVPSKRALRAGYVTGSQWDHDSIGLYSVALGYNVKATGSRSTAFGDGTVAAGANGCFASGYHSQAIQNYATAMGNATLASGYGSFASGGETSASGNYSSSFGNNTAATGSFSTASGYFTTAQPHTSFVIGRYNTITGNAASWVDTDPLFIAGNGSSSSNRSNAFTLLKDGRVGIAISSPAYMLDIENSGFARSINVQNTYAGASGKYGIYSNVSEEGTGSRYGIYNSVWANATSSSNVYGSYNYVGSNFSSGNIFGIFSSVTYAGTGNHYGIYALAPGGWAGYFPDGDVYISDILGIGTTTLPAGYKLAVDGKVICEEVKVQLSGSWPDYVFGENYSLMPLSSLEKTIRENKHLPGLPSAAEVEKDGLYISDMTAKLTQKVEELTLYLIELNRKFEDLKKENESLKVQRLNR
jgi:hypothetical protein